MSGNQRGYAWLDESIERSEQDEARAKALAAKWSQLHNEDEYRRFARQADYEDGRDYGPEPCEECGACIAGDEENCEFIKACEQARLDLEAERSLEIELVEDKLNAMGARMMRPYEHWNEDERYMEYQERDRD